MALGDEFHLDGASADEPPLIAGGPEGPDARARSAGGGITTQSGDEPQLGGQPLLSAPRDLSPMISGVPTRAIVEARGAYLAGNLSALLKTMTGEQGLRFKQAVVLQALWYIEPVLRAESVPPWSAEWRTIQAAYDWLDSPTLDNASAAYQTLLHGGFTRRRPVPARRGDDYWLSKGYGTYGRLEWMIMALAACVLNEYAVAPSFVTVDVADRCLYFALRPEDEEAWDRFVEAADAARRAARQWQVEAAWAILNGTEPPPLEVEP